MDEKEKAARREKIRKGVSVTRMMRRFVMVGFDEIEDFNEFMKSAIKREQDSTSRRIEEGARGLNDEEREQYYEVFSEDYQKIGEVFGKAAIDLFIVMLYARIETGMGTLCDALRQDRQKQKGEKIDSRKSSYLDQTKDYMVKVLGLDLDLGKNREWPEILGLKALRNAIVHNEGWLTTKDGVLKKQIEQVLVEMTQQKDECDGQVSGRIKVRSEYVDYILPKVRKFFQELKI